MKRVNIHQAKTHLSALILIVEKQGEHILLCRRNVPVAEIVPLERKRRLRLDKSLTNIEFISPPEEPTEDEWENA